MPTSNYFSGQGKVYIGPRSFAKDVDRDGFITVNQGMHWMGNVPKFSFSLNRDVFTHRESFSGGRQADYRNVRNRQGEIAITLENLSDVINLAYGLKGTPRSVARGTVTNVELCQWNETLRVNEKVTGLPPVGTGRHYVFCFADTAGRLQRYLNVNPATFTLKDSTPTPKTLTEGTNWVWVDKRNLIIQIINLTTGGPFTGPLKGNFNFGYTVDTLAAPIYKDETYLLSHQGISAVTVKDSSATPKTLSPDLYELDATFGQIVFPSSKNAAYTAAALTEPLKVEYDFGNTPATHVPILTWEGVDEVWIRFQGYNTADNNRPFIAEFYRVALEPADNFDLINDEIGQLTLTGAALLDYTKPADDVMGQIGRMILL